MTQSEVLKSPYKSRINNLKNSTSAFVLNIAMKPNSYTYANKNYYYFDSHEVWDATEYTAETFPTTYGIFEAVPTKGGSYLEAVSIMTYMKWDEVKEWEESINNGIDPTDRGEGYEAFKREKAEKLLNKVAEKFPDLVANIDSWYASTPLTYRDYLNTPNGSIYGIAKDFNNPIKTLLSPNTKIPNLYLTGQNLKLHGVLGVSLSALVTCSAMLGRTYLIDKIKRVNEKTE
jgi:all-trans-retinol 13,14-reductase